jgi:hypothetical protein
MGDRPTQARADGRPSIGTGDKYEHELEVDEDVTTLEAQRVLGHHNFLRKFSDGQWAFFFLTEEDLLKFSRYLERL